MPELIIKYKHKKTLDALLDLAKYFGFSVVIPDNKKKKKVTINNGVTLIKSDNSIDTSPLKEIFSGRCIDTKTLRQQAWQRRK